MRRRKNSGWKLPVIISVLVLAGFLAALVLVFDINFGSQESPTAPAQSSSAPVLESPTETAAPSQEPVVTETPEPTPEPAEPEPEVTEEVPAVTEAPEDDDSWMLMLVNRDNPLPEGYEPQLVELDNGQQVDERISEPLQRMFDDMRADGVYPVVAAGYRTQEKQQSIMDERIQEYLDQGYSQEEAVAEAESWVAIPGTSEHQLGLAVDINADGINSAGYEVYDWLAEHAADYGFIQRYPEDKIDITGISNEPWHYRYVGVETARDMVDKNLCLEEYVDQLTVNS